MATITEVLADYYNEDPEAFTLPKGDALTRGRAFIDALKDAGTELEKDPMDLGNLLVSILETLSDDQVASMAESFIR